jgi:GDP-4-dehydro-6-deoxy-D-mannose reductase
VPESELPVTEERAPAPRNPYASSKVSAEVLCRQWSITRPLDVVIARPFNHTGAGQRPDFVLPSLARELARIRRRGGPATLQAGDLGVTRDFLDVRDVVAAYIALLDKGVAGEIYNVCSGREVLLKDALALLMQVAGVEAEVATDASRLRPAEQRRMCGSARKLTETTGWQPRVDWRDTLTSLVDHWMQEPLA